MSYDLNGNATSETDALGNVTRYEYDARDNISRVINALGSETKYEYDAAGNLLSETDALGNTTRYEYTPEGWLDTITKPDGNTVTYTYDRTGQLTREEYSDAKVVSYAYNETGRLTVTEGKEGRTEYQYDGSGRIVSIAYPGGDVVQYAYDNRSNRTELIYPDGGKVSYGYDSANRMISVTGLTGDTTTYAYDALGRRTETADSTLKTTYTYDAVSNIVRQQTTGDTNVDLMYLYTLNGEIAEEQRTENGITTVSTYGYDALGQISAFATSAGESERYSYDAAGNMLEKWVNDTQIRMTYNAANQLQSMTSANGSIAYAYDANGNLTEKSMGDLRDRYSYDAAGNLTNYTGYDGCTVDYSYSALNMLTEKTSTGNSSRATLEEIVSGRRTRTSASGNTETVTTQYTYDILQNYYNVLTETTNGELTEYEYGLERIAAYTATDAESVRTRYVYDVRGSVIRTVSSGIMEHIGEAVTAPFVDAPTVTVQSYSYTPFGEQITADGEALHSGYTYNAEYYDAATGMLNLRARQYEPAMMRFARPDVLRGGATNPASLNRYIYCQNDPVNFSDPSGMKLSSILSAAKNTIKTAAKVVVNAVSRSTAGHAIVKSVQKIVTTVKAAVKAAVKEYNKQADAKTIRTLARNKEIDREEFLYLCSKIFDKYKEQQDVAGVIVYINEQGGLPKNRADVINEIAESKDLGAIGVSPKYEDLTTEKPNRTWIEKLLDAIFPTAYAPGYSYVKIVPDEAFYPLEIDGVIDWAKYNIVLPIEQMTEEDIQSLWAAYQRRYDALMLEGGIYNTINFVTMGIPDAAMAIYRANGKRGEDALNDPSFYNIVNYFTMGLEGTVDKAINTSTTDPEYWRALRNIALTETGAIAMYNAFASGTALPTTTEGLVEWGNKMGAPQGNVSAGTFDEAFDVIEDIKKINKWKYRPSDELYWEYKDVFDDPKYFNQETGSINWPENYGFLGDSHIEILKEGTLIDRYGAETGSFVSSVDTPYEARSLSPTSSLEKPIQYVVVKPIEVNAGEIAPWFNEVGGGIQYKLPNSISTLIEQGIIRRVG